MKIYKTNINKAKPFITKDSSIIRSIIDRTNAPVKNVTLAEAKVIPGGETIEHYHRNTEEIYYFTAGRGIMLVKGKNLNVTKGDAILIPSGMRHKLINTGLKPLTLLCSCSPPYSHGDTVNTGSIYKLAVFDFDGTLVDSVPGIHKNACEMAKRYGMKPISVNRVKQSVGAGLNKFLEWVFKQELKNRDLIEIRRDYIKRYRKNYNYKLKVYPGVKETLRFLINKGIKCVIISNKASSFIRSSNKYAGIDKYISDVLGRGDLPKDKPHPMPLLHVMKRFGVKPSQCIFAGDSQYDIEMARAANVKSVYLTYGYGDRKKTKSHKPDYTFSKFTKIKDIV